MASLRVDEHGDIDVMLNGCHFINITRKGDVIDLADPRYFMGLGFKFDENNSLIIK